MEAWDGKFELIDPNLILVDHIYQRTEKDELIDAIAANPRWEAFGVIVCFTRQRPNQEGPTFYCVDGQQRLRGVTRSEKPPKRVPCVVFELEGVTQEAEVFVRINEYRRALSALEKHTGKVVAKDPAALTIERVVEQAGYTIGNQYARYQDSRTIQAIGALNRVYNLVGEDGLLQTLVQLRDAWPDDRSGIEARMIVAVGNLVAEQQSAEGSKNGGYSRQALTKKLSVVSPAVIQRKAESLRFDMGGSQQVNLRRAFKVLCKI